MLNLVKILWLCVAVVLSVAGSSVGAALPNPARHGEWPLAGLGMRAPLDVYLPAQPAPQSAADFMQADDGLPAIVYLKNLAAPRVGTEPDESILADLLSQGFIVLVLDLKKHPGAVAPHLNADLRSLRRELGRLFEFEPVDSDHVYVLAEGDRLKRDIVYYRDKNNGEEYRLDLRYPSRPRRPSAVLMQIPVSNGNRMDNREGHYLFNDMIAECGLTLGYAVAQVDPPLKEYHGVDKMPEVAWRLKAAVRTIRSEAKACELADRIAVMGFSRSSGQAAILACSGGNEGLEGDGPHREFSSRVQAAVVHSGRMDHELLVKSGDPGAKLYVAEWGAPVTKAEVDAAEAEVATAEERARGAGAGIEERANLRRREDALDALVARRLVWLGHSAVNYVIGDQPPMFLCVGAKDPFRSEQIARMAEALKSHGVRHEVAVVPDMGHAVVGDVEVLRRIYWFLHWELRWNR